QALLKEWDLYCELLQEKPIIKEIHFGGGTPTFFSMAHLAQLIQGILAKADVAPEYEFSFEGHPKILRVNICRDCMTWVSVGSVMVCRIITKPCKRRFTGFSLMKMLNR